MKKLISLFLVLVSGIALGQNIQIPVKQRTILPDMEKMLLPKKEIRESKIINELIVDRVNVVLTDSILRKRTQRHRFPGSPLIDMLGINWRRILITKQKLVGTLKGPSSVPHEKMLREYDISFDLLPHLKKYIDLMHLGFLRQLSYPKGASRGQELQPPFTYPTDETLNRYRIHCECTPPFFRMDSLNALFFPTIPPMHTDIHPNFGKQRPAMGMYGAFVSDCNHHCHPEIHPYEWIWWMDTDSARSSVREEFTWYAGLLRDDSRRQRGWAHYNQTGYIDFPFLLPLKESRTLYVEINRLVTGLILRDGSTGLNELMPGENIMQPEAIFEPIGLMGVKVVVKTDKLLLQAGVKVSGVRFEYDSIKRLLSGYIRVGVASRSLFTIKVKTKFIPGT
jgi:hypothetical protein